MADRGIANECLQFCAFERTRQNFALREAAQGRRVPDGSAKFNTDLECLQVGRIVEDICIDGDRGARGRLRLTGSDPGWRSATQPSSATSYSAAARPWPLAGLHKAPRP